MSPLTRFSARMRSLASLSSVTFCIVSSLVLSAAKWVSCLNFACRSSKRFLEHILTSVSSTVSIQIPHPLTASIIPFFKVPLIISRWERISVMVWLATVFLTILSATILRLSFADSPSDPAYLKYLNGPSSFLWMLHSTTPVISIPWISLETCWAENITFRTLEGNFATLSRKGLMKVCRPTPQLVISPSRMIIIHSLRSDFW
mmetsp:Transcript_1868/g.3720  ORF Transcript_1868/g.3720 Transcript_1868/m.3720 type:complete len:203 (+) Transcript_1868:601-1209(+)